MIMFFIREFFCHFQKKFKYIFHHVILANLHYILTYFVKCWTNISFVSNFTFNIFKCWLICVIFKPKCGFSWTNVNAISCIIHSKWVFIVFYNALSKWKVQVNFFHFVKWFFGLSFVSITHNCTKKISIIIYSISRNIHVIWIIIK